MGLLLEEMLPVVHYEVEDGTPAHFEFIDTISGKSLPQDPRLDAFLDPEQAWAWQTEEVLGKLTGVEVLQFVGLDIQYFDLV